MFTTPEEEDDDESDRDTTPGWATQADGPVPWAMHSHTASPSATEPLQTSGTGTDTRSSGQDQSGGEAGGGPTREEFEMVQQQLQGLQAQVSEW